VAKQEWKTQNNISRKQYNNNNNNDDDDDASRQSKTIVTIQK
jgi:hypothetical protein